MNDPQSEPSANQNLPVEAETTRLRYLLGFLFLAGVSLIFGSTFPVMKEVLSSLSPQLVTTCRYVIAAIVLCPLLSNLNQRLIRDGTIIGLLFFGASTLECVALEDLSASRAGFTFALSIVFVTLFEMVRGQPISPITIISAIVAFAGITLMSWHSGESLIADIWIVIAALSDSVYIIFIEQAVTIHSPLKLAAVSCWVPAILGLIWSAPELRDSWTAIADNIGGLLYLGIVAIAIATVMETTGQQWVPGNEVAILRTLEPLAAALLSFWLLGETFSPYDYWGAGMVLFAIVCLVVFKNKKREASLTLETLPHAAPLVLPKEEGESNLQP